MLKHRGRSTTVPTSAISPDLLEDVYRRYGPAGPACYSLALHVTGNELLAHNAVVTAFTEHLCQPDWHDRSRANRRAWLLTRTHRQAVRALRPRLRSDLRRYAEQLLAATGKGPRLQALPAAERECLVLAYFGGYTQTEIAKVTGTPLRVIRHRCDTAIRLLIAQPPG